VPGYIAVESASANTLPTRPCGNDFGDIFRRIESDLRTRYVLGFRPDPSAAREGMHQLRVETTRPGAADCAHAGYSETAAGE
jgi:hypothetical protein